MDHDQRYPSLDDLYARARKRIPFFLWEWLDSATGDESSHHLNMKALDAIRLMPGILTGTQTVDLSTRFLGRDYAMPVGIAPVGMSGVIWPGAEVMMAKSAARDGIAYCLSTVGATTPEEIGPHLGGMGWFQLYPPGDVEVRRDLLARARDAGFHTLVLTADVAVASRRERQQRAQLTQPPKITPSIVAQCMMRPAWSLAMLAWMRTHGFPRLFTLEKYGSVRAKKPGTSHIGDRLRTVPDLDYVKWLRDAWDGALVIKGVLDPDPVPAMLEAGADALWVSNHGGRQFPAAPPAIEILPRVRAAAGPDVPLIFDSGIRSGTDVLRALAMGADFVMVGRAYHYGVAALGAPGIDQVSHILRESMIADMGQMGITRPNDVRTRLIR